VEGDEDRAQLRGGVLGRDEYGVVDDGERLEEGELEGELWVALLELGAARGHVVADRPLDGQLDSHEVCGGGARAERRAAVDVEATS
jgi:hypothetical protein